jgi:phosphatidylinositol glycan class C protein
VPLSGILSLLYVCVILGVSFVCPYWLVHIQKFKAKINGPWDEAVPRIPTSIQRGKG